MPADLSQLDSPHPLKVAHRVSVSARSTETHTVKVPEWQNVPAWLDQSVLAKSTEDRSSGRIDVGLGYTMFMSQNEDLPQDVCQKNFSTPPQGIVPSTGSQQPSPPNSFDTMLVEANDHFSMPSSMSPPLTYSFQETSIARRIHR